jgi:hypothetical protein
MGKDKLYCTSAVLFPGRKFQNAVKNIESYATSMTLMGKIRQYTGITKNKNKQKYLIFQLVYNLG